MSTQPAGFALAPGRRRALRLQLHSTHPTPCTGGPSPPPPGPGAYAAEHRTGGDPAKCARQDGCCPAGSGRNGTRDLPLRAVAHGPAESGAAGGARREEGAGGAPRRPERSRGNAPPRGGAAATGPFVGGAAGSHSGHGPRSPCTWPAQPPRQTRAWNTPFPHALENSCAVLLDLTLRGVASEDLN